MGRTLAIWVEQRGDDGAWTYCGERAVGPGRVPCAMPVLLNVRPTGELLHGALEIVPPRSLPADASPEVRAATSVATDLTWMTVREVLDYPLWDQSITLEYRPRFDVSRYARGLEHGFDSRLLENQRPEVLDPSRQITAREMEMLIDRLGGPSAVARASLTSDGWKLLERRWKQAGGSPGDLAKWAIAPTWNDRMRHRHAALLRVVNELAARAPDDRGRLIVGVVP